MLESLIVVVLILLAGQSIPGSSAAQRTGTSLEAAAVRITVVSARRAEQWLETSTELKPTRPEDVVLVLDIAGISIADFQEAQHTSRQQIFLSAAGTRYEPSAFVSGAWAEPNGPTKEDRLILVVVPRSTRVFELHFPGSSPVQFTVEIEIAPKLP